MGVVRVSDEGVQKLAARCATVSAQLADDTVAPLPGPPTQATAAAVASAYATLNATATALARRVEKTGVKVASAGVQYVAQDDDNAQQISSVGQSIQI